MHATSLRLVLPIIVVIIVSTRGGVLCSLSLSKSVVVIIVIARHNVAWIRDDMGWQLVVIP